MESLLQRTARRFRREPHLITPFTVAYSGPHNEAISGASDDHASLETALPEDIVGTPDGYFENYDKVTGIVEIKTFWNVTEQRIDEVLQSTYIFTLSAMLTFRQFTT